MLKHTHWDLSLFCRLMFHYILLLIHNVNFLGEISPLGDKKGLKRLFKKKLREKMIIILIFQVRIFSSHHI